MNARKARELVTSETYTIGRLRELIAKSPTDGQSIVNKQLTKRGVIDMLFKAMAGRSDDEELIAIRWQDGRSTRDAMLMINILREVG